MTFDEYMAFFDRWISYQFQRAEDAAHNAAILESVARIVADSDELAYWKSRDCWSMLDYAKSKL